MLFGMTISPGKLGKVASAIYDKGAASLNIFGLIDGTMHEISKPSQGNKVQKAFNNGCKHLHALKYQSIVTPDGITSNFLGPYVDSRHEARVEEYLDIVPDAELPFALYGDPDYMISKCLYSPFEGVSLSVFNNMIHCTGRNRSPTSSYFGLDPPTLEEYIWINT
ncbi:hypothetical protein PHYBLDRAFT_152822 [Phycomyces blakesleeanus NRRL 1555(-)]|uniref:DDE Tnp4 domain-containing protein n=1 Tax=Phycomyces blakesleeanus (strain ATCC 8743b / DSM 1359 / FGSC 10004 / NBRC 33097 / NRRL 1555) TaxID=763407 RepID=A0A167JI01_PHYB8|nr:hypothetical protein PHYBLDRAFT_152822 [Phycomyces blakesleeanus NRRL 1555(-)]OAD66016.1 hypothetical protein PHYBLDRAFT_152822 [Phycomyces blakesleeanus NRRL 1555(-)]|eukprot:XP_018284056.1 hypothetical protein PHYBLDRAFT_152822 [Phycomyces blakesleeanus NRRL 1555(-)]